MEYRIAGVSLHDRIDRELEVISALRAVETGALPEIRDELLALVDKVSKMLRDDLATYYEGDDKDG